MNKKFENLLWFVIKKLLSVVCKEETPYMGTVNLFRPIRSMLIPTIIGDSARMDSRRCLERKLDLGSSIQDISS